MDHRRRDFRFVRAGGKSVGRAGIRAVSRTGGRIDGRAGIIRAVGRFGILSGTLSGTQADREEDLAVWKGVVLGLSFGVAMWAGILGLIWWLLFR